MIQRTASHGRGGRTLPKTLVGGGGRSPRSKLAGARAQSSRAATGCGALRLNALIEVLYATGLRVSELVERCRGRCSMATASVLIVKGKGGRERMVPLTPAARAALGRLSQCRSSTIPA